MNSSQKRRKVTAVIMKGAYREAAYETQLKQLERLQFDAYVDRALDLL